MIRVKRVYDSASPEDGIRILVERLWPRGIKRETFEFDSWFKDVAPSEELRRWFGHEPKKWRTFCDRYFSELDSKTRAWEPIVKAARRGRVTLLYSSRDDVHNNAIALRDYCQEKIRGWGGGPKRAA
jgi:uncharacterized protein YeaO (DUF488 family)